MDHTDRPHADDALLENRVSFEKNKEWNIFVIMRYGNDPNLYEPIEDTIRKTVRRYGFKAILARDKRFHGDLYRNIEFCMEHSRYAIVVFERMQQPDFNPNVSLELGYMLGAGKYCLLLKERSLPILPADIAGHLYREFEATNIKQTVSRAVIEWLENDLGHQKKVKTVETIFSEDLTEAKRRRTVAINKALLNMKNSQHGCILRQAGSMSSLAISEQEALMEAEDPALKSLMLRERDLMESLIRSENVVRCLISPFVQIVNLQLGILKPDLIQSDVIPRFNQLCVILTRHINSPQLQIAYTPRLPYDNVLIDEDGWRVFVGRRLLRQWGFPNTTIYHERAMVKSEMDQFDSAFFDAAAVCLGKEKVTPEDCGSVRLKRRVIEHLEWCKAQLESMSAKILTEAKSA